MFDEEEVKELEAKIADMETALKAAKQDLKHKKYGPLRDAIATRNAMDEQVKEELTKLNLTHDPWVVHPSRHLFWR